MITVITTKIFIGKGVDLIQPMGGVKKLHKNDWGWGKLVVS
jgi:hypothetical protein